MEMDFYGYSWVILFSVLFFYGSMDLVKTKDKAMSRLKAEEENSTVN